MDALAKTQRRSLVGRQLHHRNTLCLALAVSYENLGWSIGQSAADLALSRTVSPLIHMGNATCKTSCCQPSALRKCSTVYAHNARHVRLCTQLKSMLLQDHPALLDQNHGEVRIRIVRCVWGTFWNPALERRRWGRRK